MPAEGKNPGFSDFYPVILSEFIEVMLRQAQHDI